MTYLMTLDNSWELMTEDELYDVNGGGNLPWWAAALGALAIAAIATAIIVTCGAILVAGFSAVMALGPVSALVGAVGVKVALGFFATSVAGGISLGIAVGNWMAN